MAIHLWDHGLTLLTVPKVACTSLKLYFYEIATGRPFTPRVKFGRTITIHGQYPSKAFGDIPFGKINDHYRIAVVREPVKRIVSCFENKVLDQGVLREPQTKAYLDEIGVTSEPDFAEFVKLLPTYRRASMLVRTHTNPLRHYLGEDPTYFSRIYDISQLRELEADIQSRTGFKGDLPHSGRSKTKVGPGEITEETRDRVRSLYSEDYLFFGEWFSVSDSRKSA